MGYVPAMRFEVRDFDALSVRQLHDLLALRARIFVVEQDCVYQDVDGKDPSCTHVLGFEDEVLVAYARVVPPGARFDVVSIGRVVVAPEVRGRGVARALMRAAIEVAADRHPGAVALAAQAHLEGFYGSLGFVKEGAPYEEDGISHLDMRRA
ncbi:MAG: GNAT family N-acetyltransferase [Sandaracinus sp.]|nr:GNAT family N-acetyltransferase [Sandaracinus sp.]MCB9632667.1 GNAT family N-acetyltransferase [Sandaracinus sp.]